jgi:hypothetical protein
MRIKNDELVGNTEFFNCQLDSSLLPEVDEITTAGGIR